jgi:hypothetical protein
MDNTIIRQDILDKIKSFDQEKGTDLATRLLDRVVSTHEPYQRGIIHGILLCLVDLDVITGDDATEILYSLDRD